MIYQICVWLNVRVGKMYKEVTLQGIYRHGCVHRLCKHVSLHELHHDYLHTKLRGRLRGVHTEEELSQSHSKKYTLQALILF